MLLDQAGIDHFQRYGWLHVPGFFSGESMDELRQWVDQLASWPEQPGRHMVYSEPDLRVPSSRMVQRIEYFCEEHSGFDALLNRDKLAISVAQLMGEPVALFKEKINFKHPGGAGFEAHQDQQAGWSKYAPLFVSVMVSIDHATPLNGCLEIEQGNEGRLRTLIGEEWQPLDDTHPTCRYVAVPTAPGCAIFFDSYVAHRSMANLSAESRRMLYATYNRRSDGDHRALYFQEKRQNFPPDCEREPGKTYKFRV
ncbi:phytanoyl-CoA dioxygenase family protein [Pseudomonas costantinii]|uniref:Phytanoyl-CoA dioxygenase n=1 Tax=Pseudomonas costantinii TaxID=168469 RepID=A0A1S2V6D1_9PSED|nr:phytanoyl-CoA dioxygenase family protein [Pseudomonas costantinii]OIN54010.1 phytanoyl-CoA dioxygenase [Pseudomonas costantinii]SED16926.1 Phytanoyl-CoA dioxygenase (PhyH) [Pseudomonas costantinii]